MSDLILKALDKIFYSTGSGHLFHPVYFIVWYSQVSVFHTEVIKTNMLQSTPLMNAIMMRIS